MIKWILDFLFCKIMGIQTQDAKDLKKIKDMSIEEKEAYIECLERTVKK